MGVKFQFKKEERCYFGQVFRPVANVSFKTRKSGFWINAWMIIDSGADFSILPKYFSEDLEISLEEDCLKDTTVGVGGEQSIYLLKNKISVKLGNLARNVPIAFFDSDEIPPLLGRLGFLETFNTEFLKSHTVVFKG